MASVFTHGFIAGIFGRIFKKYSISILIAGIICSILPDVDVIAFWFDISYDHPFGHRGFSHSIFFALILAITLAFAFVKQMALFQKEWFILVGYFFVCTASHGVLDAMTNGGLGVAFFAPFDNTRYFFPFRPIAVSPIGVKKFFSAWGMRVLISELLVIWLPMGFWAIGMKMILKFKLR